MLVSDALVAGRDGRRRARVGGLEVEVVDGRATLAGTTTLAGLGHRARPRGAEPRRGRHRRCRPPSPPPSANPLALLGGHRSRPDRGRPAGGPRRARRRPARPPGDARRRVVRDGIGVTEHGGRAIEIRPFAPEFADDAARLLADRHRAQRLVEPGARPAVRGRRRDPRRDRGSSPPRTVPTALSPAATASVVGYLIARAARRHLGPEHVDRGRRPRRHRPGGRPRPVRLARRAAGSRPARSATPSSCRRRTGARRRLVPVGFGLQHVHGIREPCGGR